MSPTTSTPRHSRPSLGTIICGCRVWCECQISSLHQIFPLLLLFFHLSGGGGGEGVGAETGMEPLWSGGSCEDGAEEWFKSYARVSLTRSASSPIDIRTTPGLLHLDSHSGVLCINGPAILYPSNSSNGSSGSGSGSGGGSGGGVPILWSHGCVTFNRKDGAAYKRNPPPSAALSTLPTHGLGLTSVLLLGHPTDYRLHSFFFFSAGSNFLLPSHLTSPSSHSSSSSSSDWKRGLTRDGISFSGVRVDKGASFIMILNEEEEEEEVLEDGEEGDNSTTTTPSTPSSYSSYCYTLPNQATGEVSGGGSGGSRFCWRSDGDDILDFDEIFAPSSPGSSTFYSDDFHWSPGCEEGGGGGGGGGGGEEEPPGTFHDFRTLDPEFYIKALGKPSPGQLLPTPTPNSGFFAPPPAPSSSSGSSGGEGPRPLPPSLSIPLSDCEDVPQLPDCEDSVDGDLGCGMLQSVLGLNETNWDESPSLSKGREHLLPLNGLLLSIYTRVCPQVTPSLPYAIVSLVEGFFSQVASQIKATAVVDPPTNLDEKKFKMFNAPQGNWSYLRAQLENCSAKADKLPLYRTKDWENQAKKRELEKRLRDLVLNPDTSEWTRAQLDEELKSVEVMAPYQIWLPVPPSWKNATVTHIRLGKHVEAADVDLELDWVLDSFWKMFSTVAGYCAQHFDGYPPPDPTKMDENGTFFQLVKAFDEDVMQIVVEQWTRDERDPIWYFGDRRWVYEHLFGEFIHGLHSRYMDACNDGGFWWSSIPYLRLLRRVRVKDGPPPNITVTTTTPPTAEGGGGGQPVTEIQPDPDPRPLNFYIAHPLFPEYDPALYE